MLFWGRSKECEFIVKVKKFKFSFCNCWGCCKGDLILGGRFYYMIFNVFVIFEILLFY